MNIDGLSLSVLITELNTKLLGGRIDKIFQTDKYTLLFFIRTQGENVKLLLSANPQQPRLHLLHTTIANPEIPPAFCMLLRKHLEDGRIAAITQEGLDRVINISIDIRGERGELVTKTLTAELMGKYSNIILTAETGTIIDSIKRVYHTMSRQREVLPGQQYVKPPAQEKISLLAITEQEIVNKLTERDANLITAFLNSFSGLGPVTVREILFRAGLPAEYPVKDLDDEDWASLCSAIHSIIDNIKNCCNCPTIILNEHKKLLGIAAFSLDHLKGNPSLTFPSMSEAMEYISLLKPPQLPEKEVMKKMLQTEIAKLQRKHKILLKDLAAAHNAEQVKYCADNIMAHIYDIPRGTAKIALDDIYNTTNEPKKLEISLNPELSAVDNAQHYYNKYNKYKRAQSSLAEQIAMCLNNINYVESITVSLEAATTPNDLADITQELTVYGLIKFKKKKLALKASTPITISFKGYTIYVGKNNRQNDLLTFKTAQPDDLWFHTKDIPGSHVILQNANDKNEEALYAAAQLAAYFSKAQNSTSVPVDYTKKRHVKKPSHAQPGFVTYEQQKTLYITPDKDFIHHLIRP